MFMKPYFLPYEFAGGRERVRAQSKFTYHIMGQEGEKVKISPYRGKGTELIKMHNLSVQVAQKSG